MTEQLHPKIDKNQLQALVRRINAGEHPDLSNYATISPILDAIHAALSSVRPQTQHLNDFLSYIDSLRKAEHPPHLHRGLLPIRESIKLTFGPAMLNRASPRRN